MLLRDGGTGILRSREDVAIFSAQTMMGLEVAGIVSVEGEIVRDGGFITWDLTEEILKLAISSLPDPAYCLYNHKLIGSC